MGERRDVSEENESDIHTLALSEELLELPNAPELGAEKGTG